MSGWVFSVVLPIGVSVATTVVIGLTVGPRLAARGKRIQTVHQNRDRFGDSVLDILALCANLENTIVRPDVEEPLRSKLQGEQDRWPSQIDDITAWLVDHWQQVALAYLGAMGVRDLVVKYIATIRGVWLSGRPLETRIRMIRELTELVQTIYFARRWRVVKDIPGAIARLRELLDASERDVAPRPDAVS